MRPTVGQKLRKLFILAVVALLVFHFHNVAFNPPLTLSYLTFSPHRTSTCDSIDVPPALDYNGQIWESWIHLEHLFKKFEPHMELAHRDFPDGQTVQPSEDILSQFLNMSFADAEAMRQNHQSLLEELPEYPEQVYQGRGVVMVAGGRYSEYSATTLGMLRLLGSRLPVEVWLKDSIEEEDGWCDELAEEGISCRFLSDYLGEMTAFAHPYQYKIAAMYFSSFEEMLFLDSDSIPVKNPDSVFNAPAYKDTGIVLWPDYWGSTESPWLPYVIGESMEESTTVPNITTVDSGQMLWDKKRHWKVIAPFLPRSYQANRLPQTLCLSAYYNYYGPKYFYTLITQGGPGWGDKDTFPTALRALSLNYTQIPHRLETQHYNKGNDQPTGSGMAMLQADPWDLEDFQPLFLHSNFIKFSVRRLMCTNCTELPSALTAQQRKKEADVYFVGQVQDRKHANWNALNHWKRIFATRGKSGLNHLGELDTERDIWRVLERLACVGVWSDTDLCLRTKRHLKLTFGVGESWRGAKQEQCRSIAMDV